MRFSVATIVEGDWLGGSDCVGVGGADCVGDSEGDVEGDTLGARLAISDGLEDGFVVMATDGYNTENKIHFSLEMNAHKLKTFFLIKLRT